MRHPYLVSADKMLKKQGYFTAFADNHSLKIAENKKETAFAYLVVQSDQFEGIGLCLNTSYNNIFAIANITVALMHIAPVGMGDPFYIATDGTCYWNDDAFAQLELESQELLQKLEPESKEIH